MAAHAEKKRNVLLSFFTGLIRIRGVLTWSTISFFGFLLGIPSLNVTSYMIQLFFFIVSTFFIIAFTFAVNNYYDINTDKKNPRRIHLNALASGTISKPTGMIFNLIFVIVPLILSLFMTLEIFVFCVFFIFWMWAYSAPPLRLKGRPGVDILWHFIAFLTLILWGSYLSGTISLIHILVGISFGIFGVFAQIDNHIYDYSFDKASKSQTFAVWIGINKASIALKISFIFYIGFLIPLLLLFSLYSYYSILIVFGGFLISLIIIKIKKSPFVPSLYYIINFFGGSVYINCLIYHINSII